MPASAGSPPPPAAARADHPGRASGHAGIAECAGRLATDRGPLLLPHITGNELSGVWMALHYLPIAILALSFTAQELARFEIPPLALGFCRSAGQARVHLWTFDGLHAARHLYEKHGFRLVLQQRGAQWGRMVDEQRFDCDLGPADPGAPAGLRPDPA